MPTFDVAVVGAGPAGSTAAYRLARRRRARPARRQGRLPARQAVRRRRHRPRGAAAAVLDRAGRRGQDRAPRLPPPLRRSRFVRTARAAARADDAAPPARPLPARAGGGGRRRRARRRRGRRHPRRRAHGRRGGGSARLVLGADGCNGASARALGLGDDIVHGVALEANFPHEPRFARTMVLEIGAVRGGYGWIFPKGDHVNVGVGGDESEGPRLRAELRQPLPRVRHRPRGGRRTCAATGCRCAARRAGSRAGRPP